jgi:hypothetical protein
VKKMHIGYWMWLNITNVETKNSPGVSALEDIEIAHDKNEE